ncbi:MAG TPA: methylated-DNA--[protein]-cysteine S-methyltransferase [Planctomycetota bacterium]|nr:methylated-DNA--[protein]-cysteine S-methyltransferase [Planctomycetota bacterium]
MSTRPTRRGAGETVGIVRFRTALGPMTVAATSRGVVASSLPGGAGRTQRERGGGVRDYLAGQRRSLDLPLDLRGTPFQQQVWSELRRVPFGRTISYAELARRAGWPGAARACGSANGANPAPLFVPCHRTIASDGTLGGFGGGLPLKRRLLRLEGALPPPATTR